VKRWIVRGKSVSIQIPPAFGKKGGIRIDSVRQRLFDEKFVDKALIAVGDL